MEEPKDELVSNYGNEVTKITYTLSTLLSAGVNAGHCHKVNNTIQLSL